MKRLLEYTPFLRKRGILQLFLIPLFSEFGDPHPNPTLVFLKQMYQLRCIVGYCCC